MERCSTLKKALIVLGIVFLVLVVLAAVGFGFLAFKGRALDKESKQYVDATVPKIVSNWDQQALLDRASPELLLAVSEDEWTKISGLLRKHGDLKNYKGCQGKAETLYTPGKGKVISAKYEAMAVFKRGPAQIRISLIKHGDNWQILGFHVYSKTLLEEMN